MLTYASLTTVSCVFQWNLCDDVFFAAQVQQWLTAPLSPRPLLPLRPTTSRPCPQTPLTRAVTPPWPLKQTAAWTATPLWVLWPAADNAHIQAHTNTHKKNQPLPHPCTYCSACDERGFRPIGLLMLVCRSALLMYSLFLLPLYYCKWLWFEIVSLLLYFCCKESEYVLMWICDVCDEREGFECSLHIAVFLATATQ